MDQNKFRAVLRERGFRLTTDQWQAITHPHAPQAIFAGPGSGKTTVISLRAAYLYMVEGVAPEQILIFTFTRKSAAELTARLQNLDASLGLVVAGTFHAIFLKLLANYGQDLPQLLTQAEAQRILRHVLGKSPHKDEVQNAQRAISLIKNSSEDPHVQIKKYFPALQPVLVNYEKVKEQRGRWDYDDILLAFHSLLDQEDFRVWVLRQFQVVMVDEFQDTSRIQWLTLHKLCGERLPLTVVGDDDQSIYRFRGAEASVIQEFLHVYPQAAKIVLAKNFRSVDPVIEVASRLIAHNPDRHTKNFQGMVGDGPKPRLLVFPDDRSEAAMLAARIRKVKATEKRVIGVLARTHHQLYAVVEALFSSGVRFSIIEKSAVSYLQYDVESLLKWLQAAVNKCSLADLEQVFYQFVKSNGINPDRYREFFQTRASSIHEWHEQLAAWDRGTVSREFLKVLAELSRLPAKSAFMSAWKLYRPYYLMKARRYHKDGRGENAVRIVAGQIPAQLALISWLEIVQGRLHELSLQQGNVRVMTFHAAKGLEFDEVFLIGLHDGAIPHPKSLGAGGDDLEPGLAEERRLLYVGCTRAKHRLWLSYPIKSGTKVQAPSRFLREMGVMEDPQKITAKKGVHAPGMEYMRQLAVKFGHFMGGKEP